MGAVKDLLRLVAFTEPHASLIKLICLVLFYVVGCCVYSVLEPEMNLTQAIYFITVTITTVGYGYFHPSNDASKIFTIFYILIGLVIIMTMFTGMTNQILLDAQEGVLRTFLDLIGKRDISTVQMRLYKLNSSLLAIGLMIIIGTSFYAGNEGFSLLDASYWVICTMTTVGYGDLVIQYDSTRIFAIIFIMSCVVIYATAVGNIVDVYKESIGDAVAGDVEASGATTGMKRSLARMKSFSDNWVERVLAEQNTAAVERSNFVLMVLEEKGLIDRVKDVQPLLTHFDNIDRMKLGFITRQDLLDFARDQREEIEDQAGIASNPLHAYYATAQQSESDTVSF